jgi:hypothetical protein
VLDARRPRAVVGVVVVRSERLQAEARTGEMQRNDVVIRDERGSHIASLPRGSGEACPCDAVHVEAELRVVANPIARPEAAGRANAIVRNRAWHGAELGDRRGQDARHVASRHDSGR